MMELSKKPAKMFRVFILIVIILNIHQHVVAEDDSKPAGWKGEVNKAELEKMILEATPYGDISGYRIKGKDLIEIMSSNLPGTEQPPEYIRLFDTVIEGGLIFDSDKFPIGKPRKGGLSDEVFALATARGENEIHTHLQITRSQIGANKKNKLSFFAEHLIFNDLRLNQCNFAGTVHINSCVFQNRATFSHSTIQGDFYSLEAVYTGGSLLSGTSFFNTNFLNNVEFDHCRVAGVVDFRANYFAAVSFREAVFEKEGFSDFGPRFRGVRFKDSFDFTGVKAKGELDFSGCTFEKLANFAFFEVETLDLSQTEFSITAYFNKSKLKKLKLTLADFKGYADFSDAQIGRLELGTNGLKTFMKSRLNFENTHFGEVDIRNTVFKEPIDFSAATFGNKHLIPEKKSSDDNQKVNAIRFQDVEFESDFRLRYIHSTGYAVFDSVECHSTIDFRDSEFYPHLNIENEPYFLFSRIEAKVFRANWKILPKPDLWMISKPPNFRDSEIESFRRQSKFNFNSKIRPIESKISVLEWISNKFSNQKEQLKYANESRYLLGKAQYQEQLRSLNGKWYKSVTGLSNRITIEFKELVWGKYSGYGTQIQSILLLNGLLIFIFTIAYSIIGIYYPIEKENQRGDDKRFKPRPLHFPIDYLAKPGSSPNVLTLRSQIGHSFNLSIALLFKAGFRESQISGQGKIGRQLIRLLVRIEWVIGYYVFGVTLLTLTNAFPFLHRIINILF